MYLFIYVLMALGVLASQLCDDANECDVTSHLATKVTKVTKVTANSSVQTPLLSTFERVSSGQIEISGPPNTAFSGCIWFLSSTSNLVQGETPVAGTFDNNGLLLASVPPRTIVFIFLSKNCPNIPGPFSMYFMITSSVMPIYDSFYFDAQEVLGQSKDTSFSQFETFRNTLIQNAGGGDPQSVPAFYTNDDSGFSSTQGLVVPKTVYVFRDPSGVPYTVYPTGLSTSTGWTYGPIFERGPYPGDALGVGVWGKAISKHSGDEFTVDPTEGPIFGAPNPSIGAAVIGDPHIHTLTGEHYTMLREGSFLLWHLESEKPQVNWAVYARYAGGQSFTKGLLLVDTSGQQASSVELTTEKCQWKTRSSTTWSPVTSEEVLLSSPSSSSHMKLIGHQKKDLKKIELFLDDDKPPIATLKVGCRQGHHINLKLYMAQKKWDKFVTGELKGEKYQKSVEKTEKLSTLQLEAKADQEFEVKQTWAELGGSSEAQQYLQIFDAQPETGLLQTCDKQAEHAARTICQKHLGDSSNPAYFEECVFDVCLGAGEAAAEMAAEILTF